MEASLLSIILLSAIFFTLSCSESNPDLSQATLEQVVKMIHDEVGSAEADSVDRCDIIPIGVKPAGGPKGYLVFSTEVSDREKLEKLVERYNELDAIRTEETGGMSTADFATEPSIRLNNGVCYGEGLYAFNPGELTGLNESDF